jgi:hypothetical protein
MVTFDMLGQYGELGNQLFQIATTCVYAKKNNTKAVFPRWICGKQLRVYSSILKTPLIETLNYSDIKSIYNEINHHYQIIPFTENMSLRGYFQSDKYFEGYEQYVRDLFTPSDYIEQVLRDKYSDILNNNKTVAVHIRTQTRSRDDDILNHPGPSERYLREAFNVFGKDFSYVIFSDNIPLVKQWFKNYNFVYIENSKPYDNIHNNQIINQPIYDNVLELYLMSKCKHNIITSSTFGWWGAWLNSNKDKKVVAMDGSTWFGSAYSHWNMSDLIPKSWKTIKI